MPKAVDAAVGPQEFRAEVEDAGVVPLFIVGYAGFDARMPVLLKRLDHSAIFWRAYPKLSSSLAGDLSRDVIHDAVSAYGLDAISRIAIGEDWSALQLEFVR